VNILIDVLFWLLGAAAIFFGIAVFRVDSMARATYALAISFVAVGLMLMIVNLEFIGIITIFMMVMEMAIMGIYMVMFMGMNPALMPMSMVHNRRWSGALAIGTFVVLAAGAVLIPWPAREGVPALDLTVSLGRALMGPKILAMLTISPVLFATMVAALVIANPRGRYDRRGDDLKKHTPDDPTRGGIGR
jgi:NADH:ubiquinone oxidoreductase subunit 6 (subunit J)